MRTETDSVLCRVLILARGDVTFPLDLALQLPTMLVIVVLSV